MEVVARDRDGDVTFSTNRVIKKQLITNAIYPIIIMH